MQTAFLRLPLAKKLLRDNLTAIVIVLSSVLVLFLLFSTYMMQKNLRAETLYKANVLAANLDDSPASEYQKQAQKLILNAGAASNVLNITVFDNKGVPQISWNRTTHFVKPDPAEKIAPVSQPQTRLQSSYLSATVPVMAGAEVIGLVQMNVSLDSIYKDFWLHLAVGTLLLIVSTVASVYLLTERQIVRLAPIIELSRVAEQVANSEDYTLRVQHPESKQLGSLSQHFNKIMAQIEVWESDIQSEAHQRREAEQRMSILENHDSLTKLPNRHFFHRLLTNCVEDAIESNQLAALAFIDIDHFKALNDAYGYDAGDLIMTTMANRLCQVLRNTDTLCRVDGDEFAAILPNIGSVEMAQTLSERLVQAVREPLIVRGKKLVITASVGVACCPLHGKEQRLFLHNTDLALKEAKFSGTNTWRIFTAPAASLGTFNPATRLTAK
ncbi:diguanylate cyclase [Undibacterium sp. Jales W-56]|uniref:diguanylate cyclase domain-containing protein n=1 Tax=Undibacterium sp. Jales W-56 TaxID=2897325 RepID=UPI0021CF1D64|nr:diguanylate cyclase [Undibacterium sp. Jales W-56]MCU6434962.1 diguanylate cyclase [Undibacterium sp. Jales W-56]